MMELEFIGKVLVMIFGCGIVFYAAAKLIDYVFAELSAKRAEIRMCGRDVRRAGMAKACIRTFNDGQQRMAKNLIHGMAEELYKMSKEWMGE